MPQDECPVCKIGRIPATFFSLEGPQADHVLE